jgi:5-methylcytosine-specific restriction endonuclease McrA
MNLELPHARIIPTHVKVEVWKRDGGKCVKCGSTTNLRYDHDIPYSKGGSSIVAENVRLLCVKHNLGKSDKIMCLFPLLAVGASAIPNHFN